MPNSTVVIHETEIPAGILISRAALRRELPALLNDRQSVGKWVCYSRDERIGIGSDYFQLIRECTRRQISEQEYVIERVSANAGSDEEEIDILKG